jgi:DNA-binding response OmpR family regulator
MNTSAATGTDVAFRRRVLLVEDNDAAGRSLARLLEAWGFDVTYTHDGTSALQALESAPPPHFLLTDLLLPDVDGREIARQAQLLVPPPRIALITGWDVDADLADYHAWGFDWIFPKPIDTSCLMSRLRESAV